MSATEILNELPKLNEAELRAVRCKLAELTSYKWLASALAKSGFKKQ